MKTQGLSRGVGWARRWGMCCALLMLLCRLTACEGDECDTMRAMDCFCPGAGQLLDGCVYLTAYEDCTELPLPPCYFGSNCHRDNITCDDVCIEADDGYGQPQCGLDGFHFDGPGGLAVGFLEGDGSTRPVVLLGSAYGGSWSLREMMSLPAGCQSLGFAEVRFTGPEEGWIRVNGTGDGCPSGLHHTTDGGASWTFRPFPQDAEGMLGGGPLFTDAAAPGWLLSGGARPALSLDGGATWEALGAPPRTGTTDASDVVQVTGFALPYGDDQDVLCITTDRAPTELWCGPRDGSAWDTTLGAPSDILGVSSDGLGQGRVLAAFNHLSTVAIATSLHGLTSWAEENPYGGLDSGDRAEFSVRPGGRVYLTVYNGVVASVLAILERDGSWGRVFNVALGSGAIFVHSRYRVWRVSTQAEAGTRIEYSTVRGGGVAHESEDRRDILWTGLVLGLRAAPVSPF